MSISIHNNEAIASIVIRMFLEKYGSINYSKSMLILPFLLQPELVSFLKNKRTVIRSLEELIIKKGELLINFNARFNEMLPLTINSLYILDQAKIIIISDDDIIPNSYIESDGKRINDIKEAIPQLCELFSESSDSIYLKLRIQL